MNEETSTPESRAAPAEPQASSEPAGSGLPSWLPYLGIAVVPAVIVGILVFVLAGDSSSGSGGHAPGIVEGLLRLSPDANTQVESYKGELPADLPPEIPMYGGADPVVSFAITTPGGTNFFVVLVTEDPLNNVFDFFRDALDTDPWQVEVGQTSSDITGIQFTRPDNADVSGVVTVHRSELDDITSILLTYEDVSASLTPGTGTVPSQFGQGRQLPLDFPEDVPIYGEGDSVVIDTYFQRGQGGRLFAVSFLTTDSQDDVIAFYKQEFGAQDWTVTDSDPVDATSFAVAVEFANPDETVQGEISADTFEDDAEYTRVDLVVQLTSGQGN